MKRPYVSIPLLPSKVVMEPNMRVAIIVAYRKREEQLKRFINHFTKLKNKIGGIFEIFVIEHLPEGKFNKGILFNSGFVIASKSGQFDRFIFHDVDSYPVPALFKQYFAFPYCTTLHYASPYLGYKYNYHAFFGGVIAYSYADYMRINGFPNTFMGWGGEDDAIFTRTIVNNITIWRPSSGNYELADHDPPTKEEKNHKQYANEKFDRVHWKSDGIVQVINAEEIIGAHGIIVSNIRYRKLSSTLDGKTYRPLVKKVSDFKHVSKNNNNSINTNNSNKKNVINVHFYGIDWDLKCKKSLTNRIMYKVGLGSKVEGSC